MIEEPQGCGAVGLMSDVYSVGRTNLFWGENCIFYIHHIERQILGILKQFKTIKII